jgi:hypothetical protein
LDNFSDTRNTQAEEAIYINYGVIEIVVYPIERAKMHCLAIACTYSLCISLTSAGSQKGMCFK